MRIVLIGLRDGGGAGLRHRSIGGADTATSRSRSTTSCSSRTRLTVKAGTTVTWTNRDDIPHTVAAKDRAVQVEGDGHRRIVFVHILDTGRVRLLLLLASAHDGNHRGRGSDGERRFAMMLAGRRRSSRAREREWPVTCTIRSGRGVFATPRCRISTRSIRWRAICCATPPMPRTPCRNATCGR